MTFKPKGPFPLFIHDLEADTKGWPAEQRYRYLRLLCVMWRAGGAIEDSDEVIADAMDLNRARNWREKAIQVRYKLESHPQEKGFLTHHRILKDIQKAAEISEKRAAAGRAGGKQLSGDVRSKRGGTPSPSSYKKDSLRNDNKQLLGRQFESWWQHVPRKVGKGHAEKAFKAARKDVDLETLIAATKRWAETQAGKDPQYIPHPATWLRGKRWTDEDVAGKPNGSICPFQSEFEDDLRNWFWRVKGFYEEKFWLADDWGPPPGHAGSQVPARVMAHFSTQRAKEQGNGNQTR